MKKTDNPVFVFGAVTAAVFLVLIVWLLIPDGNKVSGPPPVTFHSRPVTDSMPVFMVLSDIHLQSAMTQNEISATGAADCGRDLWDTAQRKIKSILAGQSGFAAPKFIIVLGDLPWHAIAVIPGNLESAHNNSGQVLHDLRVLAQNAHVPLIYVPGNNDSWDGDYYPFSTKIFAKDSGCPACWPLIHSITTDSIATGASLMDTSKLNLGCYAAYPLGKKGKLRVVVLNSLIFADKYKQHKDKQQEEATDQLQWFETQLADAATANEFVLIAMHVPPGTDGYKQKDFWIDKLMYKGLSVQNAFLDLLDKYQGEVVGLLSSHTHMDGLRKLYNKNGKLIAVDISVPGISPGHGNNPAFKLISYNPHNYNLLNFTTCYENFYPDKRVIGWGNDAFDFRAEYGCPIGTSIKACLDTLNINTLQNATRVIYKAGNGMGKEDEVNTAIDVRYK